MSQGNFSLNGTFTYLPDPSRWPPGVLAEVGTFTTGAPILQGLEEMTLTWNGLTQQEFGELLARWNTNKGNLVSGAIPNTDDGSITWDSITGYFHQPDGELIPGGVWQNVTMRVTSITRS